MNTPMPISPLPWLHTGNGCIADANGIPVAFVAHENDIADDPEYAGNLKLIETAGPTAIAAANLCLVALMYMPELHAAGLPAEFFTQLANLIGCVVHRGGPIAEAVARGGGS